MGVRELPGSSGILGTQMQSVGEVMAIGRTFTESLQKGLRSLEQGRLGLGCDPAEAELAEIGDETLLKMIAIPTPDRIFQVGELLRRGTGIEEIHEACKIDAWFLDQMHQIMEERAALATLPRRVDTTSLRSAQQMAQTAHSPSLDSAIVGAGHAGSRRCHPDFKTVTVRLDFARRRYHYSRTRTQNGAIPRAPPRCILGSGPSASGGAGGHRILW